MNDHKTDPTDAVDDFYGQFEEGAVISGGCACSVQGEPDARAPLRWLWIPMVLWVRRRGRDALKRARLYWILCLSVVFGSGGLRAAATEDATTASIPAYQTSLVYDSDGVLGLRDVQVLKHLTLFGKGQLLQLTNPVAVTQNGEVVRPLVGQRWDLGLSGAVGLFDVVHLGVYLPLTLFQNGEYPGLKVGEVAPVGFNDMRLGIKGKIPLPKSQPYELAVMSDVIIPSGNENAYGHGRRWRNDVIAEYSLAGFGPS